MKNLYNFFYGNEITSGIEERNTSGIYFAWCRHLYRSANIFAVVLMIVFGIGSSAFATAWRTNGNANINTLASWTDVATGTLTPANFTTAGDTWTIQNTMTQSAPWTVTGDVTLSSGSWSAAANAVNFGGGFYNNVSSGAFSSTGTVTFNGTTAQAISGSAATTFSALVVNNSSGVSLSGVGCTVSGNLTLTSGTFSDGGNTITLQGSITGTGTHNSSTGGKISMTGIAKSISGVTLGNVEFNAGAASAFTLIGNSTVNGALTFTGVANTLTIGAFTLTLKGTVSGMSATKYFTGGATSNLTVNSANDVGTIFFNQTTPGTTNKLATLTMNSAGYTVTLGNGVSIATTLALTAGTLNDGGNVITCAGNITGAGTHVSGTGGKITMTGAFVSIANSAITFGNLELNHAGGSTFSMGGSVTVNGALIFTGAGNTLNLGAHTLTLNGTVVGMSASQYITCGPTTNLTIGSSASPGTLYFDQTTAGSSNELATFLISGGSPVTIGNNLVCQTALTLTSGKLIIGANTTLTVNGSFTGNASNCLVGSATSNLTSGASNTYYFDQTTPGTTNNIATFIAGAGTTTLANNLNISTALTLTGTLADGGNVITCAGNITGAGTHSGSGKISMTGVAKSISGANFSNLEFNAASASAFTLTGSPIINGALTFTGAANTLTIGAFTLTLKGTVAGMSSTKYLTGNGASSNLTINATNDVGPLFFNPGTPGTTDNIVTLTMNSAGHTATLGNNCSIKTTLALVAGTLNDGGHVITCAGNITGAGTYLSGAGGKISMTGAAMSISNAAATLGNIELNHATATSFTMAGNPVINGALIFTGTGNTLTIGAFTLTLNGTVSGMSATKFLNGSANSNLTIGAPGALGSLFFGAGAGANIKNFIVNGGGSATLGNSMTSSTLLDLTQSAGGRLAIGPGATLTISGTFTGNTADYLTGGATSNLTTGGSNTYYFDQTTPGTSNNIATFIASAGTSTLGNNLSVSTLLTLTGTLADAGNVISCAGNITGAGTHISSGSGKISMTGITKSISGANFGNLDFNAAAASVFSLTGNATVNGNMSFSGANNSLSIGALTLTLKGTVSGMSATQYLTGSANSNLTINTASDLGTLYFNPTTPGTTDNIYTFTMNSAGHTATLGSNCSVANLLVLTAGILNDGGYVITNSGNISGAGTHASAPGGKIIMNGSGKSISNGNATLGNVTLNHAGATAFIMGASPVITGTLTFTGAGNTLTIGANTLNLSGSVSGMSSTQYFTGSATSNLTIGANGAVGTIFFNQTTPGTTNKILTFLMNGGGSVTLGNNMVSQSALTLTSGKLAVGAGNTLTINGSFTGDAADYLTGSATSNLITGTSSTYYFDQTTPGTSNNFAAVTVSAGTATLGNNLSVGATLTLTGTLADAGNVLTCAGNIAGAGTHVSTGSGKISMTGITKSISGATFGNLNFNAASAGVFSLTGSPTVNGNLSFTGPNNTLSIGAFTLTLKGTVSGMSSTQYLTGNGVSSNLTINSASDLGTLFFDPTTPGTTNNIATFAMNSAGHSATIGNNCSVLNTLALTAGTLNDGGNVITNTGIITGAGTHISGAGGKITMTGAAKSISNAAATLGNLELNHSGPSAFTLNGSPTIAGALIFTGAANTLTLGTYTLTLNGTVSGMSATQYFTGSATSNLTIGASGSLGTLFFNQATPGTTNKILTFLMNGGGSATLGNNMVSQSAVVLASGKLAVGAGCTLTVNGTFTGDAADYLIGGPTSNLVTGSTNTYYFDQTTPGTSNNFSSYTASTGTTAIGNNLSVSNTLTLTGTLADVGNVITCSGNIAGTGTHISSGSGKISMTGIAKSISGAILGNLDFNAPSASAFTLTGSPTINGNMSFTGANNTLSIGAFTLTLKGAVSGMSATKYLTGNGASSNLTINSTSDLGTLFFNPATPGTTDNIATFTLNSAGHAVTLGNNCSVLTTLALTAGTLNDGGNVITNTGSITGAGTHISGAGGKISMTGAAKSISNAAATLGNLELNHATATAFTMSASPTITGALIITGTGNSLSIGANTLTLNGTVSGMTAAKFISGGTTSNLIIGATGALGTLFFNPGTPGTTNKFVTFTINGGGSATLGNPMTIGTALALTSGSLADGGNVITCSGNITGTGTESGTGGITMTTFGSTISGATIQKLTLNSAGSFSLTGSPVITGTLTLSSGKLVLGSNNIVFGTAATAVGGVFSSSNMIVANGSGQAIKNYSSNGAYTFPIGDGANYSPITLNVTGSYSGASMGVNVNPSKPAQNANTTNYINRFWTVTPTGISSLSYTTTATYVVGDIQAGSTETNIAMGEYAGTLPWIKFGTESAHALTSGAVTSTGATIFSGINNVAGPFPSVSANSTICNGGNTSLSAAGSTGDPSVSYTWAPAAGLSATVGTPVTASPSVTTIYTLTVTDGNGTTATATTRVSVNPIPSSTGPGNTSPVCAGAIVTLSDNSTNATTWSWTGPGGYSSSIQSPVITPTVTGVYSLVVSSAGSGCSPATVYTTVVTVNTAPSSSGATNSGPLCLGGNVTLHDNSSNATSWSWTGPGGYSSSLQSPTLTPTVTGVYSLVLSSSSCHPATVYTTTVTVTAVPSSSGATNNSPVCVGGAATLNDHSSNAAIWSWTGPGGYSSSVQSPSITPTVSGVYSLVVSNTGSGCNPGTVYTTFVTVNAVPASTGATNTGPVCTGSTVTLIDNSTNATAWHWSGPGGYNSTLQSPVITPTVTGVYSLVVSSTGAGCSPGTIYTTTVSIGGGLPPITGNPGLCIGSATALTDASGGGTWTSGTPSVATIGTNGVVTAVASGTSVISYSISACVATIIVTVIPAPAPISGATNVCVGSSTNLSDAFGAGTWATSNVHIATVGSATGIVTGVSDGITTITFTAGTGCNTTATILSSPVAAPVTGTTTICVGRNSLLSDVTVGGNWVSSNTSVAGVSLYTGLVTGLSAGTAVITYSLETGCMQTTVVTVDAAAAPITGTNEVCNGFSTSLTDATGGGSWTSSDVTIATVAPTGVVTSVAAGTAMITYTLSTGCLSSRTVTIDAIPAAVYVSASGSYCAGTTILADNGGDGTIYYQGTTSGGTSTATQSTSRLITTSGTYYFRAQSAAGCWSPEGSAVITINSLPASISGTASVCLGLTTNLTDADAGGTWTSSNTSKATVGSASGAVSGVAAGTTTITYTATNGCPAIRVVTINPVAPITGSGTVCAGGTTTLSNAVTGGAWTSTNISNAAVGSASGVLSGIASGTSIITYTTLPGCTSATTITVNAVPAGITGTSTVCVGLTTALTDATAGGTWSSSNTSNATVVSGTGLVTGVAAGTATITYLLPTGCKATSAATVNAIPGVINGIASACVGLTTSLSDGTAGGTWSSSDGTLATVATTGIVTGVAAGTPVITYTLGTGCIRTNSVTVNPLSPVTGSLPVCVNATVTLADATSGGAWSSSNIAVGTVGAGTGIVTGTGAGTATITYLLPTGCKSTSVITVNAIPGTINGTASACVGLTTSLSDATAGGTWTSSDGTLATIGTTGIVTGVAVGNPVITYLLGTGCLRTASVTVNALANISGSVPVCAGQALSLNDAASGGAWTSGTTSVATVVGSTGVVTGVAAGTSIITYLLPTGCRATVVVTVNALPVPITGTGNVCVGSNLALSDGTGGGTWSSSDGSLATVGSTGIVTGVGAGVPSVTYMLGTGCVSTVPVTVNPVPTTITGTMVVCAGSATSLSDAAAGGTWSSSTTTVATVSASGIVTGVAGGTATITYTMAAGCYSIAVVTVNAILPITGPLSACVGSTTSLADGTSGGTWSSSDGTIATIGTSGIVHGVAAGTVTVSYTIATGCVRTATVAVNNTPSAILGSLTLCVGYTTSLSDAVPGGTWVAGNVFAATVGSATGIVTGQGSGTSVISYISGSGCYAAKVVTVNSNPSGIGGPTSVCPGSVITLADFAAGGTWSSSNANTTIDGSGNLTGVTVGTSTISYTITTSGCFVTYNMTVKVAPVPISGIQSVCAGLVTFLSDATSGGISWSSNNTSVATVGGSGAVTGVSAGTANITYMISDNCTTVTVVTVNALPGGITGNAPVCVGLSVTLTDASAGGTWASANTAIATVGSATGTASGVAGGTVTITYQLGTGCKSTAILTVNPINAITGNAPACIGNTIILTDASTGGTWSSSNTGVATVGSTGLVSGVGTGGTATISYVVPSGCVATTVVTFNQSPSVITGTKTVCAGYTTALTDAFPSGTWSSSAAFIASVGSTGVVTAVLAGSATISYTIGTGCFATAVVTVNPLPSGIGGATAVCFGSVITVSDFVAGGTWSSSNTNISVDGSGHIAGLVVGTSIVTYTLATGCYVTYNEQINPLPPAINGNLVVCAGSQTFLSDAVGPTLFWTSSNTSVATTINSGAINGVAGGTAIITYSIPTGCYTTAILTVNPLPANPTGNTPVCLGNTIVLSDATAGGHWSSADNTIATIGSAGGAVTTVAPGSVALQYTIGTGCSISVIVTVNPVYPVAGNGPACLGQTLPLSDAATGGAWSGGSGSIATIDPSLGTVTPIASGTTTVTYLLPTGCVATTVVTVTSAIAGITGGGVTCAGSFTTMPLNDATPGGSWSSADNTVATVGSTGIVTGVGSGHVNITYSIGAGCVASTVVTINEAPSSIMGGTTVCAGLTTALSDDYPDGVWTTSDGTIADVGDYTGLVSGMGGGTANISYTLDNGCYNLVTVTVNPLVSLVSGSTTVCGGSSELLTDASPGGTWSSSNTAVATVGTDGTVTGISGGYATVTYTAPTGCMSAFIVVVNPYAGVISGSDNVDLTATTTLTDAIGGGTWSASNGNAIVDGSGDVNGVSAGTVVVSYTVSNVCGSATSTMIVTVNAGPAPVIVAGGGSFCGSTTITADNGSDGTIYFQGTTSGGTSTVYPSTSQMITTSGTYYFRAFSHGIWGVEGSATVVINPVASAISGIATVCAGQTTSLTDAGGGNWSSSDITVAAVGSATGVVAGVAAGTATITYTLATGCTAFYVVTVDPLPSAITGTAVACAGLTTTLTDATTGGTWSSNDGSIAAVGTNGLVTGIAVGNTFITYAIPTGCFVTAAVTIYTSPDAISGNASICLGVVSNFTDAAGGGAWSTSDATTADINDLGQVSGISLGTATITYSLGSGCTTTLTVTVNNLPASISGMTALCVGSSTNLTDALAGGSWNSGATGIATIDASTGVAVGVAAGVAGITYTVPSGCIATAIITVNALPATVSANGSGTYCGSTTISATNGGSGTIYFQGITSGGTSTATPGASQVVSSSGTYYFRALSASGCWGTEGSVAVTINPLPSAITGAASVCVGLTTNLTSATAGGTWSTSDGSLANVGSTGIVSGIAQGTPVISYTLGTGCYVTDAIVVNPLPATITGSPNICVGATTALGNTTVGGVWSSSATGIATIGSATGIATGMSGGVAAVTYTLATGCIATTSLNVNSLPATVITSGGGTYCGNATITATNGGDGTIYFEGTASGGTSTSTPSGSQLVTASGTYYFRAQSASGCWGAPASVSVTINPVPVPISGATTLCLGSGYTMSDASGGGAWSSSNTAVTTIGSGDGSVATLAAGTSNITYTLGSGCFASATVTVDLLPAAITGTFSACLGVALALTDATTGGAWSSGNTFVATVGTTGIVTGNVTGNAIITYSLPTGCIATATVTVNANPSAIIGPGMLCLGTGYTLSDGVTGGNWSSSNGSVAAIDGSGNVSTVATGTTSITYALPTSCFTSAVITINPLPGAINGNTTICTGTTTTLTDVTGSGIWSSQDVSIATVGSSSGLVTGVVSGITDITYTLGTGCYSTTGFSVNQSPAAISGTAAVCQGLTTTLSNAVAGGIWSSSDGTIASISTAGVVSGVAGGTVTISYALGSCVVTNVVTVNPIAAITGSITVCATSTIILSDAASGGAWISGSISIASIGTDGLVTGLNAGTSIITYSMPSGCSAVTVVTVNQLPLNITGSATVCVGQNTAVADFTGGGLWSSSDITTATAGSGTGVITGVAAGAAVISYTLPTGCYITKGITVNALSAITGVTSVCKGFTVALSDMGAGGTWSSGSTIVATVGTDGIVTGDAAGVAIISYSLPNGCITTTVITVNPQPAAITGNLVTCVGLTSALTDGGGGTWVSGSTSVATIGTDGIVTGAGAGTSIITYTLPAGCVATATVTINSVPMTINGTLAECAGSTTVLTDAVNGGTWSSSNNSVATAGVTSGIITGVAGGTATITYTMAAGCFTTSVVTINPILPITGTLSACLGSTTTLGDSSPGGTWSSSNPSVASIGSSSGIVTGNILGTANISYTIPSGCVRVATVAINALPGSINGQATVCAGATTTLTDGTSGGTWSTGNAGVATAGVSTGVITGVASGTTNITYTAGSGCFVTSVLTVNPDPSGIGGASAVCIGYSITLSDFVSGGLWSSSNSNAAVGSATGVVTGVAAGTSTITYALTSTGCFRTYNITINSAPSPVLGANAVCVGSVAFVSDATSGEVSWTSSTTSVATINNSGAITGVAGGTTTITYTITTGCFATSVVTVNTSTPAITGNSPVCAGSTITLTDVLTGGTWTSNNTSVATVGSGSGIVTGVAGGTTTINYLPSNGCNASIIVTVTPLLAITGSTSACVGATTTLGDGTTGGTWSSSNTGIATVGSTSGIVTGVASGAANITYTIPSGCSRSVSVNITPMTVITGNASVCNGSTTALTDATAGGTWSSNAPFVATVSTSGIVTGAAAGTANITYLISGCTEVQVVTVNALPSGIGGSSTVCTGNSVMLSDFLSGGTWISSNGNTNVGSATGIVTGVTAGASTITYMMPGTGCYRTYGMTINQSPTAILGATTVCVGAVAFVSDATSGGISWTSTNTSVATVTYSGAVTGVSAGTTVLTYTLPSTCYATEILTVNTTPSAGTIAGTLTGIVGSFTTLADGAGGGIWSSSNTVAATIGSSSGMVSALNVGISNISYTVTNASGCSAVATAVFSVTASAPPPHEGSATICVGSTVTLEEPISGGTWSTTDANVATVTNGIVTGLSAGNAVIKYSVVSGFGTNIISTLVNVAALPGGVVITADPGTNIGLGETLTLTASLDNGGSSPAYQWLINRIPVAGATSATFISNTFSDNDSVTCEVISSGPCSGYVVDNTIAIKVSPLGINAGTTARSGIKLLPNPSNGEFTVRGTLAAGNQDAVIEVTDILGQVIYTKKVVTADGSINEKVSLAGTLANGMYMLNLRSGNENKSFHFMIEK